MIPGFNRSNPVVPGKPEWPEWPQPGQRLTGALFEARPSPRRLVVLADADLLALPADAALTQKALLTGLLTHPYIELLRFSDKGPSAMHTATRVRTVGRPAISGRRLGRTAGPRRR